VIYLLAQDTKKSCAALTSIAAWSSLHHGVELYCFQFMPTRITAMRPSWQDFGGPFPHVGSILGFA